MSKHVYPGSNVVDIISNRYRIGILYGHCASEHSPFVDTKRRKAFGSQAFSEKSVRRSIHTKRVVSIPIGRPGARNDKNNGGWNALSEVVM